MSSDYAAMVFLTRVVQRLRHDAPRAMIEIVPHGDTPHEPLERGDGDFLIMPDQNLSPAHRSVRLFDDRYACISWEGNAATATDPDLATNLALGHVVARVGPKRKRCFCSTLRPV